LELPFHPSGMMFDKLREKSDIDIQVGTTEWSQAHWEQGPHPWWVLHYQPGHDHLPIAYRIRRMGVIGKSRLGLGWTVPVPPEISKNYTSV
jgi:hypothetical protein